MKRKKLSERIIIILIVLFFAIPACALALSDSVTIAGLFYFYPNEAKASMPMGLEEATIAGNC